MHEQDGHRKAASELKNFTIPEPRVRTAVTWTYTYIRPDKGGWPLVTIPSSFRQKGVTMRPQQVVITVLGGARARRVQKVEVHGTWTEGGNPTVQCMSLSVPTAQAPTMAPDWVADLTLDALARSRPGTLQEHTTGPAHAGTNSDGRQTEYAGSHRK